MLDRLPPRVRLSSTQVTTRPRHAETLPKRADMRRLYGFLFGAAVQVLFIATVPPLFFLLRNDYAARPKGSLWIDAVLAAQFAVPHSLLLLPRVRALLGRFIPSPLLGCVHCLVTCSSLWLLLVLWRGSDVVVWEWPSAVKPVMEWAFLGSWGLLFYSLALAGFQYQTGLGPWWHWVNDRRLPPREFRPRGAYRWLRHPVYASFLALVWVTPVITADRAVLMAVWTGYVAIGSYLKDERLIFYLGERYQGYASRVRGFPLVYWGPLALRPSIDGSPGALPRPASARKAA
jgi:methanethiol S-methyltransferase